MVSAALNLLLVVLLLFALGFGMRLSRQLKALKAGQDGFVRAVGDLDSATRRAEQALSQLRQDAGEIREELERKLAEGRGLVAKIDAAPVSRAAASPEPVARPRLKTEEILPAAVVLDEIEAVVKTQKTDESRRLQAIIETSRSRARVDDDLFEPSAALRTIPGGRS